MKRILLCAVLLSCLAACATLGADTFVVGVEQSTAASWQSLGTQFQATTGIAVSIQSLPQNSIAAQVSLQGLTRSGRLNFVMIAESWAASASRYLQDLSAVAPTLSAQGITPVSLGGRPVGVSVPFATGWFLAVLTWPQNQTGAVDFLIAVALNSAGTSAPVTPQSMAATYTRGKLNAAQHNKKLDGALESLIAAAQAAIATTSGQGSTSLPSSALAALETIAGVFSVPFSGQTGTVTVVLESSPGKSGASNASALRALGLPDSSMEASSSLVKVNIPVGQLASLVTQLSGVSFIRAPYEPYPLGTTGEGTAAIGASAYHSAGITGAGVKVAVIDLGFSGLAQAQARGDLPATVVQNDLTGTGLTSGISHGTAVAEVVYDIAPGAELTLIKINDDVDLDQAVTYCLANGIDIINHSLGWYNTSNYDGTGTIADIARRAVNGGILWVNAVGNEAQTHWRAPFIDANADGWGDTSISLYVSAGAPILLYLTWNEWPAASTDYDLYLYDPSSNLLASSSKYQTGTEEPTESIQTTATVTGNYTIRFRGSGSRSLNLYNVYQILSPSVAASSILSPADVAEVVAVGAIPYASYASGPQEPYSSQGPTTDGRMKPDLVCPDNVSTGTPPYTAFAGTSAAAPHAAGAAALLLSVQPSMTGSALRSQLLSHAASMGSPNIYGLGRLALQAPAQANQPPVAAFTFSPSPAVAGQPVTFYGSSSSDSDGQIVSWQWTFGDGFTGSTMNPSHTYAAPSTYTVTLTVQDDDGAVASVSQAVPVTAVPNQTPTAAFTMSATSVLVGQSVSFNGSASGDSDGYLVSYTWAFGDGGTASGASTSHAYASQGTYAITLTVQDDDGATASVTHSVSVAAAANQPPAASFTASAVSVLVGQSVSFNGSASSDADGYVVSYAWSFGDGGSSSGPTVSHGYASQGIYTVILTVQDDDGATASASRQITVQAPSYPDLVVQSLGFSPLTPAVGQSLTFAVVVRNQGTATAGAFRVRLSGASLSTTASSSQLAAGGTRTLSLVLPLTLSTETYTVVVDDLSQVAESNESNNMQSVTVTASTPAPVARAGGPYAGTAGSSITFNGSASTGTITSYSWSFGDGFVGSGAVTSHSYSSPGTYLVTLTVSGPSGTSSETTQAVIGSAGPTLAATVSLPKSTYTVGEAMTITVTLNRPAYVYLCEITADNRVVLLFPSAYEPGNSLAAGSRVIPGGAYTLRVSEPTGNETLRLYAATGPITGFPTSFSLGFPVLSTNPSAFHSAVIAAMQVSYAAGDRATSSVAYTIQGVSPTTGTLRVSSTPTGATVRLDGTSIGTTNLERPGVTPGPHTVEISRSGYQTETRSVSITAGTTTTVQVTLTPVPTNQSPVAAFTYSPSSPLAGTVIAFDASASSDPDGSIVSYAWSFGDGSTASTPSPNHAYVASGSYSVQLTVTDNGGRTAQVARTVTVVLSADVGWISPIAFSDPDNQWYTEEKAYDNDRGTRAAVNLARNQWSSYLILTLPSGGVLSDRVRIYVSDSSKSTTHTFTWSVEGFVDGAWVQIYQGKPAVELKWIELAFTQGTVTQLRLRAYLDTGDRWLAYLWEIDAHDSTASP